MKPVACALSLLILAGCATHEPSGRYSQRHDSAPERLPGQISLHDAKPHYIAPEKRKHNSYKVYGISYYPMQDGRDYIAEGEASWYGQKFHGYHTSNGETYDMYSMTAAHKTLPLPTFVRVTNLANNQQAIVRVNDRGPFHGNRIIDLSYVAAKKLDMLKTGTAKVRIEAIHVEQDGTTYIAGQVTPAVTTAQNGSVMMGAISAPEPFVETKPVSNGKALFIQVAALSDRNKVQQLAKGLESLYRVPYHLPMENGIYRLRLGPLNDEHQANKLLSELKKSGYSSAYTLYAPHHPAPLG
ncbi:septal ring lytic transglycosylase RlpA family protein [Aliiglaciecola sp. CAU 1673]|uniref:septal ring lytic transglycosylase RlpA family protein n=1 Tax=Aliiglaciecola sp. CAU 1673 TaxID=3032595 RepID=UPI0023DAFF7B|nr:septal ring lytic transglycosylase RlpA family protein [Aliiglaciecola sp. CAU 1673]MDF2179333.1 septal ring lytic transglycosylase RlpA family protein [Aliiglaciecola sp. CAU 1673]